MKLTAAASQLSSAANRIRAVNPSPAVPAELKRAAAARPFNVQTLVLRSRRPRGG